MRKIYAFFASLFLFAGASQAQLVIFDDDYAPGITFSEFGGSVNVLSIDPTNARPGSAGTKSLKAVVPAAGYTGGALLAASNQNVTSYNAVSFWVKASKAGAVLNVTGLGNTGLPGGLLTFQVETRDILIGTAWVKLIIPIPDATKLTAVKGMWHFAEGSEAGGAYDMWFDDIQYETISTGITGPSVTMTDQNLTKALGTTLTGANVRATYGINSIPRVFEVAPAYLNYICNPVGRVTFDALGVGTTQTPGAAAITATMAAIAVTGTINVTVTAGAGAPAEAAPTPTRNAANVISVFSDAYTPVPGISFDAFRGASTRSLVQIAGNSTMKYESFDYHGFGFAPALNLTTMTKLHFDLWTPDANEFQFFLISPNPTVERPYTVVPAKSGWNSYDVLLSTFSPVVLSDVFQFKIVGQPFGTSTAYLDNIYFFNEGSLPVKLTSFTAAKKDKSVVLNWQTATETNNKGFAVERSRDGQTWSEFNFVKATASNGAGSQYATADNAPAKGMNYYRLKQIDSDGKATYSAVKVVNFNANGAAVSIYPNPTRGRVNVNVSEVAGKVFYSIVQVNGKTVLSGTFNSGTNVNAIDVSALPKGTYLINITGDQFSKSEKLMVQ